MTPKHNTLIESIGVYLPPQSSSTDEILRGCRNKIQFPLESIAGIRTRRMAGITEFSVDLAKKAVDECLSKSKYAPSDIDLLICCNISRWDGPGEISFEPCTSIKLKKHFGFTNALVFDVTNACAGMFTAIYIIDSFIKTGAIKCSMVVSGEYITHLTQTAQREIESFMDPRLACLTLGDAAAAMILEKATDSNTGFQEFDIQTFGRYSPYCVAKASDSGGFIMHTDSVNMADVAIKSGATHALNTLHRAAWSPDSFQYLVMHQTSRMTLNSASREINRLMKANISHSENTINNLEQRGNTASTAHFIAIADHIQNNKIRTGDKIVFSISASGLTIGTALYTFDDLPDRVRLNGCYQPKKINRDPDNKRSFAYHVSNPFSTRVQVESIGTIPLQLNDRRNSMELLKMAASNCLNRSSHPAGDIELLIYSGVYRTDYVLEPAYAALLAGEMDMNATTSSPGSKTLAFDIFNSATGFLNAVYVAQKMIESNKCHTAMIVAAECDNNSNIHGVEKMDIRETGSALILERSSSAKGFSRFLFSYELDFTDGYTTCYKTDVDQSYLAIVKDQKLEQLYVDCIIPAMQELMMAEGLDINNIDMIFPPQISSGFIEKLSAKSEIPFNKFIEVTENGPDLFSSSLPYTLQYAFDKELVKAGDTGLVVSVGAGLQVACAIYHF